MKVKPLIQPMSLTVAAIFLLTGLVVQSLPEETARALAAETGPFEIASVVLYGVAAVLAAVQLARRKSLPWLAGMTMLLWAFLRELDFQKRFTYRSIESIGYYTRPYAPWFEKLLVLLILAPFCMAGLYLLRLLCREIRPAFARGEKWVGHLAAAVCLGALGSVFEKMLRWGAAEEVCEMGLALLVVLLVWEWRETSRRAFPTVL